MAWPPEILITVAGIGDGMDTFTVTRREAVTYPVLPFGQKRGHGCRAPGHVTMILREGSGWIAGKDGATTAIAAPAVVAWHAGDWIEYGSDGSREFSAELFWATDLTEQEREAALADIFRQ
jgi:hypothetical protein